MIITTVTTAAPATLLVSADALAEATSASDRPASEINRLAASMSTQFEKIAGRKFAQERLTEKHILDQMPRIVSLSRLPVTIMYSVTLNGIAQVENQDYYVTSMDQGVVQFRFAQGRGLRMIGADDPDRIEGILTPVQIEIDYTGGYVLPDWDGQTATLPADIEFAVADAVKGAVEIREQSIGAKESERIGDYSVTYQGSSNRSANSVNGSTGTASARSMAAIASTYRRVVL